MYIFVYIYIYLLNHMRLSRYRLPTGVDGQIRSALRLVQSDASHVLMVSCNWTKISCGSVWWFKLYRALLFGCLDSSKNGMEMNQSILVGPCWAGLGVLSCGLAQNFNIRFSGHSSPKDWNFVLPGNSNISQRERPFTHANLKKDLRSWFKHMEKTVRSRQYRLVWFRE